MSEFDRVMRTEIDNGVTESAFGTLDFCHIEEAEAKRHLEDALDKETAGKEFRTRLDEDPLSPFRVTCIYQPFARPYHKNVYFIPPGIVFDFLENELHVCQGEQKIVAIERCTESEIPKITVRKEPLTDLNNPETAAMLGNLKTGNGGSELEELMRLAEGIKKE